jgi:thiol-disulfide isomerase/thioredoxin
MSFLRRALAIVLLVFCGVRAGFLGDRWWIERGFSQGPVFDRDVASPAARAAAGTGGPNAATTAGAAAAPARPAAGAATASASGSDAEPIPQTLPDVRMPDLSGTEHSLTDYRGHPLLVNFWATWCPPCRHEMPLLQQLWTEDRAKGLVVVGVAVDSPQAVKQYLKQTKVTYPLMVGFDQGSAAVSRFGIQPVLPFSVFADGQGRIIAVKVGELHRAEGDFIVATLDKVTAGQENVAEARGAIAAELRRLAVARAKQQNAGPAAAAH